MCAITGFYKVRKKPDSSFRSAFIGLLNQSQERGRDGFGFVAMQSPVWIISRRIVPPTLVVYGPDPYLNEAVEDSCIFLANHRAEPTTEFIRRKRQADQQPYNVGNTWVVHNGTIANDRQLCETHAWEPPTKVDSWVIAAACNQFGVEEAVNRHLVGSMATAIVNADAEGHYSFGGQMQAHYRADPLVLYRNYQPLYLFYSSRYETFVFSSFPDAGERMGQRGDWMPLEFPPYSLARDFRLDGRFELVQRKQENAGKAFVICSGGLDSTTVATMACRECEEVTLLHFKYGCKAEEPEVQAVLRIRNALRIQFPGKKIELEYLDMGWLKQLGGSPLTEGKESVRGDAGAEYAHEWVPARNTAMIGVAASHADRYNVGRIYLGLNLEESGAYPDNTVEFYRLFSRVLDVGTVARPQILNPLATMTKKEIVAKALEIGAPIHLSWSCYDGYIKHCGRCGPCVMRRTAFEMLGVADSIEYEHKVEH